LAWGQLSVLESFSYFNGISRTAQTASNAEHAAKRALALNPESPEASLAMGYVVFYIHRDYAEALARFEQVYQSQPSNIYIIGAIAFIHRRQGKWQESLSGLRKVAKLNPRSPDWHLQ